MKASNYDFANEGIIVSVAAGTSIYKYQTSDSEITETVVRGARVPAKKLLASVAVPPAPIHGATGYGKKELETSVAVSPARVRVPSQWPPLVPNVTSVTSVG